MGVRILEGKNRNAVFYCSTSDWAFGPVMESAEEAEAFAKWLPQDPRVYSDNDLESKYLTFKNLTPVQKHESGLCETLGIEYDCPNCEQERKWEDEVISTDSTVDGEAA